MLMNTIATRRSSAENFPRASRVASWRWQSRRLSMSCFRTLSSFSKILLFLSILSASFHEALLFTFFVTTVEESSASVLNSIGCELSTSSSISFIATLELPLRHSSSNRELISTVEGQFGQSTLKNPSVIGSNCNSDVMIQFFCKQVYTDGLTTSSPLAARPSALATSVNGCPMRKYSARPPAMTSMPAIIPSLTPQYTFNIADRSSYRAFLSLMLYKT
mmetsp:Transcript_11966/g.14856  ORF Transcript_11966/g.14856 Transcript_11966/m.14856 type:complete len:219 (+) Transcript_11966:3518-4174(+)